jgi:hypothetical protein
LKNGNVQIFDSIGNVLNEYQKSNNIKDKGLNIAKRVGNGEIRIMEVIISSENDTEVISSGSPFEVIISYNAFIIDQSANYEFAIGIWNSSERPMLMITNLYKKQEIKLISEEGRVKISINKLPLNVGLYSMNIAIRKNGIDQDFLEAAHEFQVEVGDYYDSGVFYHSGYDGVYSEFEIDVL